MFCLEESEFKRTLESDALSGSLLGNQKQVEVLGWYTHRRRADGIGIKVYAVKCHECAKDPELFGDGFFSSIKDTLSRSLPCGCSKSPKWDESQYKILCKRRCDSLGIEFGGWAESFRGNKTKCLLSCPVHGEWRTTPVSKLLHDLKFCFKCSVDRLNKYVNKPDEVLIAKYMATGSFVEGTKMVRSANKEKWMVTCPVCKETNECYASNLNNGKVPCSCSRNPRFSYINLIKDGDIDLGIKFGITSNPNISMRLSSQNKKSVYDITNYAMWQYDNSQLCKTAERVCMTELDCGVFSKQEVSDGYTETTTIFNLPKVIKIFEDHGGVRLGD